MNATLLGRPRRQFVKSNREGGLFTVQQNYPDWSNAFSDPVMNSKFRITARDAVLRTSVPLDGISVTVSRSVIDPLVAFDSVTGVGAWTDQSDVIRVAEQVLRDESGIEIPKSSLVVKSLGYYLLILVPVNYLFFRLIGRLEYAWMAVPLIAIGGAVWVARTARLDIGFARSQTEIAMLEMQPDYERGHLSRVVAIYNSLSSNYDIDFKTVDAAAAPIISGDVPDDDASFRTGFTEGPSLAGLAVASNTVRMLHAEQMVDVGGSIEMNSDGQLVNRTDFDLLDTFVVERIGDDRVQIAAMGMCESGSAANVRFRNKDELEISDEIPERTRAMLQLLGSPESMPKDSMRMVARIEESIPGMTITPEAIQRTSQTIVIAHLRHAQSRSPEKDVNLIGDLREVLTDDQIKGQQPSTEDE